MMPESNFEAPLLDDQTPLTPVVPPTSPLDEKLDDLERLRDELRQIDDETPASTDALWPTDFCLSIVVPVYNEAQTIAQMLEKLIALAIPKQVIIVDDGSTDGTQEVLAQWMDRDGIEVILKCQNEGKGAALRTGFEQVEGDLVAIQDADLEYDPNQIPSLVRPILAGEADVVYGSRFMEQRWQGSSAVHRFGNRMLTALSNATTGLELTDMETCYKVFPTAVLNDFEVRQDRFGFEPEVTAKLARRDLRFLELPVDYNARDWTEGKKIGFRDAVNAIYCILRYAWRD